MNKSSAIQYDLFRSGRPIGVYVVGGTRNNAIIPQGLRSILSDTNRQYEMCDYGGMEQYEHVLCSITSVDDIVQLCKLHRGRVYKNLIVGGQGIAHINALSEIAGTIVVGRADNQIDSILAGKNYSNVWRVGEPKCKPIEIMQAKKLYEGELSVGCKYRCKFCRYSHTLRLFGGPTYHHGRDLHTYEDNLIDFDIDRPGRYTTALDGLSEHTRRLIAKPISDALLAHKIQLLQSKKYNKAIVVKIYTIIGFPWETPASVDDDINKIGTIMKSADMGAGYGRVVFMFMFTPFSPEPNTPLELAPANIATYWRESARLYGRNIYRSETLEAFCLPQINGPKKLLLRCAVNRGAPIDDIVGIDKIKYTDWQDFLRKAESSGYAKYAAAIPSPPNSFYVSPMAATK